MVALWQTSVSRVAVMSRSSLWHIVGNPPMGQIIALSTENWAPQLHV